MKLFKKTVPYLFALLPLVFVFLFFNCRMHQLSLLESRISYLKKKATRVSKLRAQDEALLERVAVLDTDYLEKHLATRSLLQEEVHFLKTRNFHNGRERLNHLQEENRFSFSEGTSATSGPLKESIISMQRPVEIDEDDLKHLLSTVEEQAPALFFKEFSLSRQKGSFLLEMKLVRRTLGES